MFYGCEAGSVCLECPENTYANLGSATGSSYCVSCLAGYDTNNTATPTGNTACGTRTRRFQGQLFAAHFCVSLTLQILLAPIRVPRVQPARQTTTQRVSMSRALPAMLGRQPTSSPARELAAVCCAPLHVPRFSGDPLTRYAMIAKTSRIVGSARLACSAGTYSISGGDCIRT